MDRATRRLRLFELFNEIGIIQQLASSEFNRRLTDGLHVSHFSVINHLCRLGDGRTPLQLARAFQVTKPTMTNTLGKLSASGLVEIRANPEDGRSKLVFLTDDGRDFRDRAIATLFPLLDKLDEHFGAETAESVLPTLRRLRTYLDENRGG